MSVICPGDYLCSVEILDVKNQSIEGKWSGTITFDCVASFDDLKEKILKTSNFPNKSFEVYITLFYNLSRCEDKSSLVH